MIFPPPAMSIKCPLFCQFPILVELEEGRPHVRSEIATLCNHLMAVHHAGPTDAWAYAVDRYPVAAKLWGDEVKQDHNTPQSIEGGIIDGFYFVSWLDQDGGSHGLRWPKSQERSIRVVLNLVIRAMQGCPPA